MCTRSARHRRGWSGSITDRLTKYQRSRSQISPNGCTTGSIVFAAAHDARVVIAPAMAFYGGLGDFLATAAIGDWAAADEICIVVALDSWQPTLGTRRTGQRNTARRLIVSEGKLAALPQAAPMREWYFPAPFGAQKVVALPFTEIITIAHHLGATAIHSLINLAAIEDIRNPDTPTPTAVDGSGRSAQRFHMEALVRNGDSERRWSACGRDICAITAPIVVEATERILDGRSNVVGVAVAGELFDAEDFLRALSAEHLSIAAS